MDDAIGAVLGLVVGLAFVGIGGYMIVTHMQEVDAAKKIDATVVNSGVEVDTGDGDDGGPTYYPEVTYEYTYNGTQYTNDVVFPGVGTHSVSQARAREIANKYSRGSQVTAYIVPGDPKNTFLIKQPVPIWLFLFPGIGGVVALASLATIGKGVVELVD